MNNIRKLREAKGWTQARLGKELRCTAMTVSRYESEQHSVDAETINLLCDIFGCTADYLLGRFESPSPAVSDADAALLSAFHAAPPNVIRAIDTLLEPYKKAAETDRAG